MPLHEGAKFSHLHLTMTEVPAFVCYVIFIFSALFGTDAEFHFGKDYVVAADFETEYTYHGDCDFDALSGTYLTLDWVFSGFVPGGPKSTSTPLAEYRKNWNGNFFNKSDPSFSYAFEFANNTLHTNMSLFFRLPRLLTVQLEFGSEGDKCIEINTTLKVSYCSQLRNTKLQVEYGENASYGKSGFFRCYKHGALYYANGFPASNSTKCNAHAEWEGSKEIQCWFAPDVIVRHDCVPSTRDDQLSPMHNCSDGIVSLQDGANLALECSVQNQVEPPVEGLVLYFEAASTNKTIATFEGLVGKENITVNSSHHLGKFRCQGVNNFTKQNKDKGLSKPLTIHVAFEPEGLTCSRIGDDGKENLTITFKSNPQVSMVFLILDGRDAGSMSPVASNFLLQEYISQNETYGNVQTFSLKMNFSGKIIPREGIKCVVVEPETAITTVYQDRTTTLSNLATGVDNQTPSQLTEQMKMIIIISASIVAVTLIATLIVLIWRRKNKELKKEEVINPIYDSTAMSTVGEGLSSDASKSRNSEKVERENPLYGTTAEATYAPVKKKKKPKKDSSVGIPEATGNETYATVVKPKKEKKKGSDNGQSNDAFSGEADATYAAVNKKKKHTGKSEDEPSTSGLGNNAQVSQECTYAAVQKKGKKKPKDDDEDLHGSSK